MAKDWMKNQIKRRQHAVRKKKEFKVEISKAITKTSSSTPKVNINKEELIKLVEENENNGNNNNTATVDQTQTQTQIQAVTTTQTTTTVDPMQVSSNWKKLEQVLKNKFRNRPKRDPEEKKEKKNLVDIPLSFSGDLVPLSGPTSNNMDVTDTIAIDCEMVGVGKNGKQSALGCVCIVNSHGNVIYKKFCKPLESVTDYRTQWSGLRAADIENGTPFKQVQFEVACIVQNRILVGHELKHDLNVLIIQHPPYLVRDTAHWGPLRQENKAQSLKQLAKKILGAAIQLGEHNPQEDAWTAFLIYRKYKDKWEDSLPRLLKKKLGKLKMTKAWKHKPSKIEQILKTQSSGSQSSSNSAPNDEEESDNNNDNGNEGEIESDEEGENDEVDD